MSENTDLVIMPNGMRVQKNLVDSKKEIQSAKAVRHAQAVTMANDKRKNSQPVGKLAGNHERPIIDPYRSLQNEQKPSKKIGKAKAKNQRTRKASYPPVLTIFPKRMKIGTYFKYIPDNKVYKIIDRTQTTLTIQNPEGVLSNFSTTNKLSQIIKKLPTLHIEVLLREREDLKDILLNAPVSKSIAIIKATMKKFERYPLFHKYLVPSVLNEDEFRVWKSRIKAELERRKNERIIEIPTKPRVSAPYLVVRPQDFMVRVQTFSCSAKGHALESIQAKIITRSKGSKKLSSVCIPAGYCEQCKRHYILSSILESYSDSLKYALCGFVESEELNQYLFNMSRNTERFAAESTLRKCGYTVSEQSRLTSIERVNLLNQIIDWEILTRGEVKSFLNWLITFQASNPRMRNAIRKWRYDLQEISKTPKGEVVLVKKVIG